MAIEDVLTKVLQYSCNVSFEDFRRDFGDVVGHEITVGYADEKMELMRSAFPVFYCNLDEGAKARFVQAALRHYGLC